MSSISAGAEVLITRDSEQFAEAAGAFLAARVERNVLASVLEQVRGGQGAVGTLFAIVRGAEGQIVTAALRTPPWPLLVTDVQEAEARALALAWLAEDPAIPGASGEPASVRAFVAAWSALTGARSWLRASEAMHALSEVVPPGRPAGGSLRLADGGQLALLAAWEREFVLEAGTGVLDAAEDTVRARLAAGREFVWDDGGPVCALAHSPLIAGTVRIGPVYTPPERRCRGYASSAVAALAQRALEGGATRVMLYTDLANPTSNKIYATIGFRRFGSWEDHLVGESAG
ncbi:MAG TPA: GNAT family N-acetyltransferase [Solirubrobacteraceae bacterium]|jgi:predicted GNAT family acetyltransferase|nr:GNAT family N-acetyltransferase [Solirubrobacteraceae bacterium]